MASRREPVKPVLPVPGQWYSHPAFEVHFADSIAMFVTVTMDEDLGFCGVKSSDPVYLCCCYLAQHRASGLKPVDFPPKEITAHGHRYVLV